VWIKTDEAGYIDLSKAYQVGVMGESVVAYFNTSDIPDAVTIRQCKSEDEARTTLDAMFNLRETHSYLPRIRCARQQKRSNSEGRNDDGMCIKCMGRCLRLRGSDVDICIHYLGGERTMTAALTRLVARFQGEQLLTHEMGGEVAEVLETLVGQHFYCMGPVKSAAGPSVARLRAPGGLTDDAGKQWWAYYRCSDCEYETSWWKIESASKRNDLSTVSMTARNM